MGTATHVRRGALDDAARGDLIFSGGLITFVDVVGLAAFRSRIDDLVRTHLRTDEPELAQFTRPHDDYLDAVRAAQQAVRKDEVAHGLLADAFRANGVDTSDAYWDWVHLRVNPSGSDFATTGTGWHRDTWASSLSAQTNWWTPIYPITEERTIAFAPAYWSYPVANSSAEWTPRSTQVIPEPLEAIEPREQRIVVEPGDLLCFSGAHLHRTVRNETGRARFSIEVRTLCGSDVRAGRGAAPVDGVAPQPQYGWFHHMVNGSALAPDDATS
ncbi:MAG: hypothetical protein L0K86_04525 [Actinomycetia bacterium]|nr:hypothetical protein [Actinomycetes bacterium]